MMKSLMRALAAGTLIVAAGLVGASQLALKSGHPDVYYVKQGDTLWDISSRFLDNPWQWPELWHHNEEIDNPHLIYPGDVIRLTYIDGQPQLVVERGEEARTVKIEPDDDGVVRLSPEVRTLPLSAAIPAIPMDAIQTFLNEALVVSREEIAEAPYIIGGEDKRVIYGRGDLVHARDPFHSWERLVQDYGFYRVGERYVDPETNEILGFEALQIGTGRAVSQQGDLLTLRVRTSKEDLRAQDRVMTTQERTMQSVLYPSAPDFDVDARIIRFFGRLSSVARNDVVVINRGVRDGLRNGNVLEVMQAGEVVRDRAREDVVRLPSSRAGTIVLFNVFEKVSYGLVIESVRPIYMQDMVRTPSIR